MLLLVNECPKPEVRDSRTFHQSAHAQSQVWQISTNLGESETITLCTFRKLDLPRGADQMERALWVRECIVNVSFSWFRERAVGHACVLKIKVTDASIFYADNLSLTCVLYRLILWCGESWKMEPVEDSLSAKKCLTGIAGTVQWRCTRSYQSLITKHFPTVSLMYWLLRHFY